MYELLDKVHKMPIAMIDNNISHNKVNYINFHRFSYRWKYDL